MFIHDTSPIGEARRIEPLRVDQEDLKLVPQALIDATVDHMKLTPPIFRTEADWISGLRDGPERPLGVHAPPLLWLLVAADWSVYPNLMTTEPWWRLGSLVEDRPEEIIARYLEDHTPGQRALQEESGRSLADRYGDSAGERIYMSGNDLVELYLERHLREQHQG